MTHRRLPKELLRFRTAGFFVLRAPLLPFDVLEAWGSGLEAPDCEPGRLAEALAGDRRRLRERLRRWLEEPVVREALFLASPGLEESLPKWWSEPESEWGQKLERAVVRYFMRMAGRATPFGLFAGLSLGQLGEDTRLPITERSTLRRHTRLDMDYVSALVEAVSGQPEVRRALRYVPNSSLYRAVGGLRYMATRLAHGERGYELVAAEPTPYLEATLERAQRGATLGALAEALVAGDPDVELDEARAYVDELVDAQLLVSTWAPPVTGPEPVPALLEQARQVPALDAVRERLGAVHQALRELDERPPGISPQRYREVAGLLEGLPTPVELPRLFQVDMFRPAPEATLSGRVVEEMLRASLALERITPRTERLASPIERFREKFLARYEGRSVPLLEALDEESGIGFERSSAPGAWAGPLLQGLAFPKPRGDETLRDDVRWRYLLPRLEQTWRAGAHELVLTDEDLEAMRAREGMSIPDAFGVAGTLVAPSAEAVDRGDFRLVMENLHGPSGAIYLGRFCHGEPPLEAAVRGYLDGEAALRPDAVFAELVHLPQGRLGNILCRPALRRHDIVFLGQSGVAEDERIEVTDLWVSVEGARVVLRSKRLGREVIPRLTNAHNFTLGLGVYRFLALMQFQGCQQGMTFRWGPLDRARFLPRVVYGRTVLSLARWKLPARRLREWAETRDTERFAAVQRLRRETGMPRWVSMKEADTRLPIDLDNALCVEMFVQLVKERTSVVLEELYPGPGELCASGADGRYVSEVIVPFLRAEPLVPASAPRVSAPARSDAQRHYPPGGEWLYLKLYTGEATADRVLCALAEPLRRFRAAGVVDHGFFIRYGDPDWHLRLRLHGEPARLHAEVFPALSAAWAGALARGEVWRVQLDTYERELERYGGPVGMALCEQFFSADSEAALAIVEAYGEDEAASLRWKLAFRGLDALLEDLGLSLEEKAALFQRLRGSLGAEFRVDKPFEVQLGQRYRRENPGLEALLALRDDAPGPFGPGLRALSRRSEQLRPIIERLKLAEREGQLTLPLLSLADSLLHMHANRVLTSDHRAQELVLYDFLERLYRSRLARRRREPAAGRE